MRDLSADASPDPSPWRWVPWLLALLTFALYGGALGYGFVNYDDMANVVENHHLARLSLRDLKWMFTGTAVLDYKPMVWLSYAADRLVWGMNPLGFHLTNLLLHVANVVLVYGLAVGLLRRAGPAAIGDALAVAGAAMTAVLFAVHPQRVESVVWISERKDVLYGFFYLASMMLYLRWAQPGRRGGAGLYLAFTLLGVLAMLSKPMAVSLPVILLLLDATLLRRGGLRRVGVLVLEKLPLLIAAVLVSLRTISDHAVDRSLAPVPGTGAIGTLLAAGRGVVFYLEKTFWPVGLSPFYAAETAAAPAVFGAVLVLVVTAGVLAAWARGRRWPAFLWLFFLVSMAPALPSRNMCDRFTYLPSLGLVGLAVGAWLALARRGMAARGVRVVLAAVPLAAAGVLAWLNWDYAAVWADSESLWSCAAERSPSARAHYMLSAARLSSGEYRQALRSVDRALELDPEMAQALNARGAILATLGRMPEAAASFERGIAVRPDLWEAHENLGSVLMAQDRADEAMASWRRALEFNPTAVKAHLGLARACRAAGRGDEALEHYDSALRLWPSEGWLKAERNAFEEAWKNRKTKKKR